MRRRPPASRGRRTPRVRPATLGARGRSGPLRAGARAAPRSRGPARRRSRAAVRASHARQDPAAELAYASTCSWQQLTPSPAARASLADLPAHELEQELVLLGAGWAAHEVRTHPGKPRLRIRSGKLDLDVPVEEGEALLATDLGPAGPEHAGQPRRRRRLSPPAHRPLFG